MEYIDELSFYFEPQDIALVERNLKTEKSNFYPSFQQIIQKDNMNFLTTKDIFNLPVNTLVNVLCIIMDKGIIIQKNTRSNEIK